MKNYIVLTLLIILFCSRAFAQTNLSDTESLIRELSSKEITAVVNHDHKTLEDIWAQDFMVNNPYNMVINGRSVVLDRMKEGTINYSAFEREIEGMMILDNTAIEMGLETVYPKEGAPMAGQKVLRRYTNFWMMEDGKWMIKARHANVICMEK
ncbi:nuclear transport factor 2 family protein [Aquiflexum sp.]|uniref:nuclear transport factor 2 family protein n=1 Tax=Aquiflexum sp. TaxID=1872584 RepID=UPI0035945072